EASNALFCLGIKETQTLFGWNFLERKFYVDAFGFLAVLGDKIPNSRYQNDSKANDLRPKVSWEISKVPRAKHPQLRREKECKYHQRPKHAAQHTQYGN